MAKHWVSYHLTPCSNGIFLFLFNVIGLECCYSTKALPQQISAQYSSKTAQSNLKAAQLSKTVNLTGKIQYKGKTTIKQTIQLLREGERWLVPGQTKILKITGQCWPFRTHNQFSWHWELQGYLGSIQAPISNYGYNSK